MTYYPQVDEWLIPEEALSLSFQEMARDGLRGNEGIALWLGERKGGHATVSHVLALRGRGVIKRPDFLSISPDYMNAITDFAIGQDLVLVGQIHSHGPLHGVNLSPTDTQFGVQVPGYLSIVAPDYALRPPQGVDYCGVHVFDFGQGYRRLSLAEVVQRVKVTKGPAVRMSVVRGNS